MSEVVIESPVKVFRIDEKRLLPDGFLVVLLVIAGIVVAPVCFGIALVKLALHVHLRSYAFLTFYSDYSEVKPGPMRSSFLIPNSAIISVRHEKKSLVLDVVHKGKKVARKIPIHVLTDSDVQSVVEHYQSIERSNLARVE
ncbi:hypothetical protein [Vibrio sp. LaRot3]|uniref:hypothetical protein n=1 Tax=Vibrio sp. LaRot3 TaxID=2998829 RepID=UPI0022CE31BB|nr:hypothetical protein [Vibrio sp. LaRot3]MDA0150549.1 hypothetical protein [Vibrio sp. LaRot3]